MATRTRYSLDALLERLRALAEGVESRRLYWLDPGDPGESYCRRCAQKYAIGGVELDGGFSIECDSQETCADCGVQLLCSFTDYGVREEIGRAVELDSIDAATAWTLERIVASNFPDWDPGRYYPDLLAALETIWRLVR